MTCALSGMNCSEPLTDAFIRRFTEPDGQLARWEAKWRTQPTARFDCVVPPPDHGHHLTNNSFRQVEAVADAEISGRGGKRAALSCARVFAGRQVQVCAQCISFTILKQKFIF